MRDDVDESRPQELRRRLDDALQQLEPLQALMRHNPDLAARFDREHRHLYVNPAVEAATGIDAAEFIGKTNQELGMPPELCRMWDEARASVFDSGSERRIEFEYPGPDGPRWYQSRIVPEFDREGRVATVLGITREITEVKRVQAELVRSRQELADFLENATVGLHWVGRDGIILWANRVELEMLGYEKDEYVGRHIAEFHADQEVIEDILERLGRGEEVREYEARLRAKDGTIRHVAINSNVRFENGEFVHTRCFTSEITERKEAESERERLMREVEEASQAKSEFLATISHELRTPLNAIVGYADLMLAGVPAPVPDEARRHAEGVALSARHLIQLIDEILTFSRLEAGREEVALSRFPLADLVEEVAAIVKPLARAKGLEFVCAGAREEVELESDPRKVRQILLNLVGNAIKFTERGRIGFRAAPVGDQLHFEVSDTGIGITPEDRDRVFEPFWQGSPGRSSTGGTGLGLSVARDLARALGGDIHLESEPAAGSTFILELPLRGARGSPPSPRSLEPMTPRGPKAGP